MALSAMVCLSSCFKVWPSSQASNFRLFTVTAKQGNTSQNCLAKLYVHCLDVQQKIKIFLASADSLTTVKASNIEPHWNFEHFIWKIRISFGRILWKKKESYQICTSNSNIHPFHLSVGSISTIERSTVFMRCKVRGFHGILEVGAREHATSTGKLRFTSVICGSKQFKFNKPTRNDLESRFIETTQAKKAVLVQQYNNSKKRQPHEIVVQIRTYFSTNNHQTKISPFSSSSGEVRMILSTEPSREASLSSPSRATTTNSVKFGAHSFLTLSSSAAQSLAEDPSAQTNLSLVRERHGSDKNERSTSSGRHLGTGNATLSILPAAKMSPSFCPQTFQNVSVDWILATRTSISLKFKTFKRFKAARIHREGVTSSPAEETEAVKRRTFVGPVATAREEWSVGVTGAPMEDMKRPSSRFPRGGSREKAGEWLTPDAARRKKRVETGATEARTCSAGRKENTCRHISSGRVGRAARFKLSCWCSSLASSRNVNQYAVTKEWLKYWIEKNLFSLRLCKSTKWLLEPQEQG